MPNERLDAAIKEAYASAPSDVIIYDTVEIWHPAFSSPIYLCRDDADIQARIESSAPRNASQIVTFVACGFDLTLPSQSSGSMPELLLEIDNVHRDIVGSIELAVDSNEVLETTYRAYASNSLLSGPKNNPPIQLEMGNITANVFRVGGRCSYFQMSNKAFPSENYTTKKFPGLK